MSQIETHIDIDAPIEKVWGVFTDFDSHKEWNPFLICIQGVLEEGRKVKIKAKISEGNVKVAEPTVTKLIDGSEAVFLAEKGFLFKGEHYFKFESLSLSTTRVVHGEKFSGLLPKLFWSKIQYRFTKLFNDMNQALKVRAEL